MPSRCSVRRRPRRSWMLAAVLCGACGGRGGLPPERPGVVRGPDGQEYRLVQRGAYKAFYDRWGRLERLDHDGDGDGRTDAVVHYDGARSPHRVDLDTDADGRPDRFERYDPEGRLTRTALSRRGGAADTWLIPGSEAHASRREYDDDGDGRVDRAEVLGPGGLVARVEVDADRDGRFERFQAWEQGRMTAEDIDTDKDGRADRRLRYDAQGRVTGMESLAGR